MARERIHETTPVASPNSGSNREVEVVNPGSFEPTKHFYQRTLNAQIHPLVRSFLRLGNERIAKRYCHVHPKAVSEGVANVLGYATRYFQWGGADLFVTTSDRGQKRLMVVETNSCPSGQKSMPLPNEDMEQAGYRVLLERAVMPVLRAKKFNGDPLPEGILAVLYDKNKMEASGYAAALADLSDEPVYLTPCYVDDFDPKFRFREDGVLEIRTPHDSCYSSPIDANDTQYHPTPEAWKPVRVALRYVTQRPWSRIPPLTCTPIFNPVLACLAGGRNKMLAAKAYDLYNAEIASIGLTINTPESIWDVTKREVPLWVRRMGGLAVVKVPYSNAGQGVWTITREEELIEFMQIEHRYDRFIVQALIGNNGWSSVSHQGQLYHVGTVPDLKGNIYAVDLRVMVGSSPDGFFPVAIYARRARLPLAEKLDKRTDSWDMLGTNLSFKAHDGSWGTDSDRLLMMDSRDFNCIGIGVDDLIEAYMQTVLAVSAIDGLACKLITPKGNFGLKLFQSLNPDPKLLAELYPTALQLRQLHAELSLINVPCAITAQDSKKTVAMVDRLAAELEEKLETTGMPAVSFCIS